MPWINRAIPTHKIDGTCCFIDNSGVYRRYDRKLSRIGITKLWKNITNSDNIGLSWDIECDFKKVPDTWIPTMKSPNKKGHWPGFCKLDIHKKDINNNVYYNIDNDKWYHHAITPDGDGFYTVEFDDKNSCIKPREIKFTDVTSGTWELIGPMVQNNMYNFPECINQICSNEQNYMYRHYYVQHGSQVIKPLQSDKLDINFDTLKYYIENNNIEGIVWKGTGENSHKLCKLHREHLGLEKCQKYSLYP